MQWTDKRIKISDGKMGDLTKKLYDKLTGIQYGREKDEFGWIKTL
jgi:branched-chain amino acid aminotransferase